MTPEELATEKAKADAAAQNHEPTTAELKAENAAFKERLDKLSGLVGSLQTQLRKAPAAEPEPKEPKTPVEKELADLKAQLKAKDEQAQWSKVENAMVGHLSDKVGSPKIAKDIARLQIASLKETQTPIVFEGDSILVGTDEKRAALTTHLDSYLAGDGADYAKSRFTPSSDGLNLGGATRVATIPKGYHRDSNGAIIIEAPTRQR